MSKGVNKVILIGTLGKDPEVKYTPGGQAVTNFSIATNESYKDKAGELVEKTEWHDIVAWGRLAEICGEFLAKGRQVYIEGKLQTRSWDDKETGQKRYKTEVVAREMTLLGGNGGKKSGGNDAPVEADEEELF